MLDNILIKDNDLSKFGDLSNLSVKAEALLNQQKEVWELVKNNFAALSNVETKSFHFGNYEINTQYNPSRIISSSAKVDKKSIEDRKCFLCKEHLPEVQKGILYKEKYVLLVNPYPIFKEHLTIPNLEHVPQKIEDCCSDLLELSKDLEENFFVFYNGPKCGASAPDHLHFQAGLRNSTPLEKYFSTLIGNGEELFQSEHLRTTLITSEIFNLICIQSDDKNQIEIEFERVLKKLKKMDTSAEEPLLNIISLYKNNMWNLFVIPRKKHRPDQFFAEDDSKLLISPASVDIMGLLITPRENDFNILTKDDITDIYNQVLLSREELLSLFKL